MSSWLASCSLVSSIPQLSSLATTPNDKVWPLHFQSPPSVSKIVDLQLKSVVAFFCWITLTSSFGSPWPKSSRWHACARYNLSLIPWQSEVSTILDLIFDSLMPYLSSTLFRLSLLTMRGKSSLISFERGEGPREHSCWGKTANTEIKSRPLSLSREIPNRCCCSNVCATAMCYLLDRTQVWLKYHSKLCNLCRTFTNSFHVKMPWSLLAERVKTGD